MVLRYNNNNNNLIFEKRLSKSKNFCKEIEKKKRKKKGVAIESTITLSLYSVHNSCKN